MPDIKYIKPDNLKHALDFLWDNGENTKIIAGGTDVMVDLRAEKFNKKYLLDISKLHELKGIFLNNNKIYIGSGVTLSEIYLSEILKLNALALKKCAYSFAGKQIRNVATIGGNVAHSSPSGDTIPPLMIHKAKVLVADKKSTHLISMKDIISNAYKSCLSPKQIIVQFILNPYKNGFADFQKIARRKELAISRISMAFFAKKDLKKRISFFKFSLGACTPIPCSIKIVENFLMGKVPNRELIWEAGRILAEKMIEITGMRFSTIYKKPGVQGLFMRMLYPII